MHEGYPGSKVKTVQFLDFPNLTHSMHLMPCTIVSNSVWYLEHGRWKCTQACHFRGRGGGICIHAMGNGIMYIDPDTVNAGY